MVHVKKNIENFARHIENDHTINLQESVQEKKSEKCNCNGSPSEQEKLRVEEYQVLDLSRRYESNGISSSDENHNLKYSIKSSPSTSAKANLDSVPSTSTTNSKTLAASLEKIYAHHAIHLSTPANYAANSSVQNQLINNSQGYSIFPIYYPQIKREKELSPKSQEYVLNKDEQLPILPQAYHHHMHVNLIKSLNLMQAASYPEHILPGLQSLPTPQIQISPKPSLKLEDKSSVPQSSPKSPSSSSINYYSKLKNSTTLTPVEQQNHQQSKPTRPFKAYPRDPTVIAANFAAADSLYNNSKVERYSTYRKRILDQIRSANGGERTISNPKMRRTNNRALGCGRSDESNSDNQLNNSESEERTGDSDNDSMATSVNTDANPDADKLNNNNNDETSNNNNAISVKDEAYFERRRKNNAAAKKSRDRRRIKEDEIAIRAAYLERQNIELLCQLDSLKTQLASLTKVMK